MHGKTQKSGGRVITYHLHRGERENGEWRQVIKPQPIHSDLLQGSTSYLYFYWGLKFDNNISHFLPPNLPIYPFLLSLKFMTSLSVNSYYMHVSIC